MNDEYRTLAASSEETLFKDRGSKFFGYAFPVQSEEEVKLQIDELRAQHSNARHFCYAFQLGVERISYRANDDGEPNNSAGMPIYGQIQSFNITNVLVVSVRYFGGTKLGVGGLINAYRNSAKLAIEASQIIVKTINVRFRISFSYDLINKVMRIIKEQKIQIVSQNLELNCTYIIAIRKKESEKTHQIFAGIYGLSILKLDV